MRCATRCVGAYSRAFRCSSVNPGGCALRIAAVPDLFLDWMFGENEMKNLALLFLISTLGFPAVACAETKEEPVQHIEIADLTSMEEAEKIFIEKTAEIRGNTELNEAQLQLIHILTYTLEKSVEYFTENLEGEEQLLAKEIAVVVEDIHLSSEKNRKEATRQHLDEYFELADKLMSGFE
jgi:PP-loop superfamily ATP-utilizing enzyme